MRRLQLMLAACAAALLTAPTIALAAQAQQGAGAAQATGQQHHGQVAGPAGQHPRASGQGGGHQGGGHPGGGHPGGANVGGQHPMLHHGGVLAPHSQSIGPAGQAIPGAVKTYPQHGHAPHPVTSPILPTQQPALQPTHRPPHIHPAHPPAIGGWDRRLRGHERDRAGEQWREQHRGWEGNSPWRHDRNWWRHNGGFHRYVGPRIGFFFVPAFGYVAAPPEYENRYWASGEYLPSWFWRFVVSDYQDYGLPAPPDGCAWVWVNSDLALIDLDDGYILDIIHNVW